jgi:hypothetical protein
MLAIYEVNSPLDALRVQVGIDLRALIGVPAEPQIAIDPMLYFHVQIPAFYLKCGQPELQNSVDMLFGPGEVFIEIAPAPQVHCHFTLCDLWG